MSNRPRRQPSSSQRVREASGQASRGIPSWVWLVVVGVVAVVAALAIALGTGGEDNVAVDSSGSEVEAISFGEPRLEGTPLPPLAPGGGDAAVGQAAPAVRGQDLAGEPMSIPADGRPKVLAFLAHWCPHCQAEVPRLAAWEEANGEPADVDVYSVVTGTDETRPNYPPGAWLRREGWPFDVLVDDADGTVAEGFGLSGFPFFVVVGADGDVVLRASGELTEAQWEALLEAARTGRAGGVAGGPSSPG